MKLVERPQGQAASIGDASSHPNGSHSRQVHLEAGWPSIVHHRGWGLPLALCAVLFGAVCSTSSAIAQDAFAHYAGKGLALNREEKRAERAAKRAERAAAREAKKKERAQRSSRSNDDDSMAKAKSGRSGHKSEKQSGADLGDDDPLKGL